MNEKIEDLEPADDLLPGRFTIDERFYFSARKQETPSTPGPAPEFTQTIRDIGITVPMPEALEAGGEGAEGLAADTSDPLIGKKIGNYEILRSLGQGGFGSVYQGRDMKLDRFVAIKFLRFPLDPEYRKLFAREAKVLANLGPHSSIVQIYTWGEYQGSYYFVLEFLDSNADAVREHAGGRLPARRALQIAIQCADALHYAHNHGVLHRDVKPANILIDLKTECAKLCDFGLARFYNLGSGGQTMQLAGSPPYMAPEQITGAELDARTDVYALGITLYELLSGRLPFEADSHAAIFDRIRKGKETPLSVHRPDLSHAIQSLVRKAAAWHPRDRFQSALEFQRAAQRTLDDMDSSGSSTPPRALGLRRLDKKKVVFAAMVLVLVGSLTTYGAWRALGAGGGPPIERVRDAWPADINQARDLIDAGRMRDASSLLDTYLHSHPKDSYALYALGFAEFLLRDFGAAASRFENVDDDGMRAEGLAAVEQGRGSREARAAAEEALKTGRTGYPSVLLASLDYSEGKFEPVVSRLKDVDPARMSFEWQRRERARILGQAYMKLGEFAAARQYFVTLPEDDAVGGALLAMAVRQEQERVNQSLSVQIARLSDRAATAPAESEEEWTSRPLRLRIEPVQEAGQGFAGLSGLSAALPELLAARLESPEGRPYSVVDRQFIGDVLFEQELSTLSAAKDAVAVGRLRGARVMVRCEFRTLMNQEYLAIKLIDTETTSLNQLEDIEVTPGLALEEWVADVVSKIKSALMKNYPIQARLSLQNGAVMLDAGRELGVSAGMQFSVFPRRDSGQSLGAVSVEAIEPVDATTAAATLVGASSAAVPAEGWFVRERISGP